MGKVKVSSPEMTTVATGLCALRGIPGTCLGHFFGSSTNSELEAARQLRVERCDHHHRECSTFKHSNCVTK